MFGKRVVRVCLRTRYYTNSCVHCYGYIIVDGERDARGRWHRSGHGLRRGILLGLRETAKSIAAGPELAFGSDSRPCRNNAVSRSPSSNHPSSAAARPDATFLWLTLPADRKTETISAQRTTINIEEYRNQIGTTFHSEYRSMQTKVNNAAHTTTQNSFRAQEGGGAGGGPSGLRNSEMAFPLHIPALKMRPA